MNGRRDLLGDLEANHAEILNEMRMLALKLSFLARASVVTASAIADLHAKAGSDLLTKLLNAENPGPRRGRKKVSKGASRR